MEYIFKLMTLIKNVHGFFSYILMVVPQNIKTNYTQDFILLLVIRLHLELFLFLFFIIISKPLSLVIVILRLCIFFCKPILLSSIYFSICIIYVIKIFNYLYNLEHNESNAGDGDDIYEKYKYKLYIISSGLVAGFVTYFVIDKSVNYMGDKFIASGLLSEESKKMIIEMQKVPFKFDVFCISFCVGSSIAYMVSKQVSSN